ncbi:MAG: hypothetical protein LBJ81_02150 [Puniceicoccales bacterium]|jgi:hypothetical protein|nr:hypothetical protein [Puniceicoccales bacterium]
MSLIFDGLRRRGADKKGPAAISTLEEGAEKASDSPDGSLGAAVLAEEYREALVEPDSACITVDYSSQKGQSQPTDNRSKGIQSGDNNRQNAPISSPNSAGQRASIQSGAVMERNKKTLVEPDSACITVDYSSQKGQSQPTDNRSKGIQSGDNNRQNAPISSPNSAEQRHCNYGQRIEMLRKNIQKPAINFTIRRESQWTFLQSLKRFPSYCLIAAESALTAPYKLLKFLCGAPLKSINFCSSTLASFAENICEFLRNSCLWLGKNCLQMCRFLASGALQIALFPVKILNYLGRFFVNNLLFLKGCCAIAKEKSAATLVHYCRAIGNGFAALYQACKSGFYKIISINLPASLIQSATVFLIKSSVAAVFFHLAITFFYKNFYNKKDASENRSQPIKTSEELSPKRKLKHLYRDPLLLQQEKIRDALLALHIDTIQRQKDGTAYIVTDNRRFCIGALLNEHPKIRLEKVGKRSLYFSDKYGQWYKRSIQNLLD